MASILDGLAARREQLLTKRSRVVPIPDWTDPTLALRLKPLETSTIERITKAVLKSARDDMTVAGQAAIVAASTVEVIVGGSERVSLKDFGAHLGLTEPDAGDIVRAACITGMSSQEIWLATSSTGPTASVRMGLMRLSRC